MCAVMSCGYKRWTWTESEGVSASGLLGVHTLDASPSVWAYWGALGLRAADWSRRRRCKTAPVEGADGNGPWLPSGLARITAGACTPARRDSARRAPHAGRAQARARGGTRTRRRSRKNGRSAVPDCVPFAEATWSKPRPRANRPRSHGSFHAPRKRMSHASGLAEVHVRPEPARRP